MYIYTHTHTYINLCVSLSLSHFHFLSLLLSIFGSLSVYFRVSFSDSLTSLCLSFTIKGEIQKMDFTYVPDVTFIIHIYIYIYTYMSIYIFKFKIINTCVYMHILYLSVSHCLYLLPVTGKWLKWRSSTYFMSRSSYLYLYLYKNIDAYLYIYVYIYIYI